MNFIKNNMKLIIGFLVGVILTGGIVYAATSASQVDYITSKNGNIKNVEQALNDLYDKISNDTKSITSNGEQTLEKYYNKLNVNVIKDIDDIIISSIDDYTTTQTYSKAYVIITRLAPNLPVFKRNNTDLTPIKTRASYANEYNTCIYSVENVIPGEEWSFKGTAEILYLK